MSLNNQDSAADKTDFETNKAALLENMRRTLDPELWGKDIGTLLSQAEIENNVARCAVLIATLILLNNIKITDLLDIKQSINGDPAVSFKDGELVLGDIIVYLGMGGRVISSFAPDVAPKVLHALFNTPLDQELPISKTHNKISKEERDEGKIAALRSTSTHLMQRVGPEQVLEEGRGMGVGIITLARNTLGKRQNLTDVLSGAMPSLQIGVNQTCGGVGNDSMQDSHGKEQPFIKTSSGKPSTVTDDGGSGHLLLVLQGGKINTLMMGYEQAGFGAHSIIPGGEGHGLRGVSPEWSPFGVGKHSKFSQKEYVDAGLVMPKLDKNEPLGSMHSEITNDVLKQVKQAQDAYLAFAAEKLAVHHSITLEPRGVDHGDSGYGTRPPTPTTPTSRSSLSLAGLEGAHEPRGVDHGDSGYGTQPPTPTTPTSRSSLSLALQEIQDTGKLSSHLVSTSSSVPTALPRRLTLCKETKL